LAGALTAPPWPLDGRANLARPQPAPTNMVVTG